MFRTTAGLLALGAILVASRASLGQGDASYTVTIKKVEVKKTQKNGDAWDVNNGAPDLRVIIRNATSSKEKAFESKEKKDVFAADFDEPTTVKFRAGDKLEIEVVDVDVAVNDLIGKTTLDMKEDKLREGKMRLEDFDQVIHLEIDVKKL
jgi:hypothetical protein